MSATGTSLADASKKHLLKFHAADRYANSTGGGFICAAPQLLIVFCLFGACQLIARAFTRTGLVQRFL